MSDGGRKKKKKKKERKKTRIVIAIARKRHDLAVGLCLPVCLYWLFCSPELLEGVCSQGLFSRSRPARPVAIVLCYRLPEMLPSFGILSARA